MNFPGTGWVLTIIILFLMTFGLLGCLKIIIYISLFLSGGLTVIYIVLSNKEDRPRITPPLSNPLENIHFVQNTLEKQQHMRDGHNTNSQNIPITGNAEVDRFFYELSDLIIEDYVSSWYRAISSDEDFIKVIKHYVLFYAVELSSRVQSADWLYHISGKVVEDMASHLRLFRGAGGGVTSTVIRQPRRGSPAHSPARTMPHHRRNKSDTDVASYSGSQKYSTAKTYSNINMPNASLEQKFFELEFEIEKKSKSREGVSTDSAKRSLMLSEISQIIIFLTLNSDETKCNATTSMLRALLTKVFESIIDYIVNPDVLNSTLLKMTCRESLSTESFLAVLRTTDNVDELKSTLSLVQQEIHNLVSNDNKGECDIGVKQQLSSLQYLTRLLSNRSSLLTPTPPESTVLLKNLPMGFLLDNHLALCYFLDFAHSMNAHPYIFCYLSIEAWRAAASKEMDKCSTKTSIERREAISAIQTAASTIFEQYFSKNCRNRLDLPSNVLEAFFPKMNATFDSRCVDWFNEIEKCIYKKLESVEYEFRISTQYIRLLAELDLEGMVSSGVNDQQSSSIVGSNIGSKDNYKYTSDSQLHSSFSSLTDIQQSVNTADSVQRNQLTSNIASTEKCDTNKSTQEVSCRLEVVIVETGLMQERGKTYGVYALDVKKWDLSNGKQYRWHVYRRYSDFHELYATIKENYPELSKLEFPSKKTFHNTSRSVLESRMATLSSWISELATLGSPGGPPKYAPLHLFLLPFLNPRGPQDRQQTTTINTMLVQPLRQGMRTLRNVPEHLASTVDDIMEGLSKLINTNKNPANTMAHVYPMNAPITFDGKMDTDELPLRVVLLLLDEVFELRSRNRWLRRQIATIMRQILTTMFSDVLNRKIIDMISTITSPASVIYCLENIKRAYEGKALNTSPEARDPSAKSRARVAAKTVLLSCRQDELKHLLGSQTTQKGLITVFELFQNDILNTRLIFVLLEGLLKVLYQDKDINLAMEKLLQRSY